MFRNQTVVRASWIATIVDCLNNVESRAPGGEKCYVRQAQSHCWRTISLLWPRLVNTCGSWTTQLTNYVHYIRLGAGHKDCRVNTSIFVIHFTISKNDKCNNSTCVRSCKEKHFSILCETYGYSWNKYAIYNFVSFRFKKCIKQRNIRFL